MFKWRHKLRRKIDKHYTKPTFKKIFKKLLEHKSPHEVAVGLSIGTFFSVLPLFGVGMLIALLIAWKKRLNLVATYIGTIIVNPFNVAFVYYADYKVGSFILGENNLILPVTVEKLKNLLTIDHIQHIGGQMLLGGIILATTSAIIVLLLVYGIIYWYKDYKERKKSKIQEKLLMKKMNKK